jgi:hypothetical protein
VRRVGGMEGVCRICRIWREVVGGELVRRAKFGEEFFDGGLRAEFLSLGAYPVRHYAP